MWRRIFRAARSPPTAGCRYPSCEFFQSNLETRQHYDRKLMLVGESVPAHALECIEFARAVAEGAPSPVPAEQSLQVMGILDGIYRSQKEGREVDID